MVAVLMTVILAAPLPCATYTSPPSGLTSMPEDCAEVAILVTVSSETLITEIDGETVPCCATYILVPAALRAIPKGLVPTVIWDVTVLLVISTTATLPTVVRVT